MTTLGFKMVGKCQSADEGDTKNRFQRTRDYKAGVTDSGKCSVWHADPATTLPGGFKVPVV